MKKIGLLICLLFILLGNVNAETSKDIMIKYEYKDNTSKYTKKIVDNKAEYEINEDKIKILLSASKDINVLFFEVSTESLEWLKTKADISKEANVYYLKILNSNNESEEIPDISIEEYSGENKVITIYNENGNKIENVQCDCYIAIEKSDKAQIQNNENVNVYKDLIDIIKGEEQSRNPLIIFVITLITIFVILLIIVKTRKDKDNE